MSQALMFWKQLPTLKMSAAEIARELTWGEDVEGLVDLPIKEVIERFKAAYPQSRETPGLLTIPTDAGKCDVTWSWQHVRLDCHDVSPDEQQKLVEILSEFGCTAHEPPKGTGSL